MEPKNNQNVLIDIRLVWLLAIVDLVNTIYYATTHMGEGMATISLFLVIALTLILQVILISDMVKNNVFNRPFWVLSMVFFSKVAQFFYLMQRGKLIAHGGSKEHKPKGPATDASPKGENESNTTTP